MILVLYVPLLVHGEEYKPLVGIPGVTDTGSPLDFNSYINSLYTLSISIAALLAVIKIVIAGVKYMLSDIVTQKGEAKKDIQGALIGLLIVLSAVLILTVINPDLVEVDLTLNKPVEATFAGNAVANPTLDATKVKSFTIPGTTATVSYLDSTDATQEVLFAQSCNSTVSSFTNPQVNKYTIGGKTRCVTYEPTETVTLWPGTKEACEIKGIYKADPLLKTGYCVIKK